MSLWLSLLFVIAGLALVLFSAERLVDGTLGVARGFGLSAFLVSTIFLGFDPENLAVGAVGGVEGASGIALGTVVGSAMVAIALAFGLTALVTPLRFGQVPRPILGVPVLAAALLLLLAWDGRLSRLDGALLLAGYAAAIAWLVWLSRRGLDIESAGLGKKGDRAEGTGRARAVGLLVLALVLIVAGSELLVTGTRDLIARFGLSQTFIGMTVLALAISIEEVARELPAALRGHPEISYGNVAGSVLAFFLFNAGIIALLRPLEVAAATRRFYLPMAAATVVVISGLLLMRRLPRWAGALLVALYVAFVGLGYWLYGASAVAGG